MQNKNVRIFIKIESLSIIKLSLKILIISLGWLKTKTIEKIRLKIVNKFTSLKLFFTNTPIIKRDIIISDINNSGNI